MPQTKKEKAKELWDYYQVRKVYGDNDNNEDMLKLVLICGNCDHHDLLVNFREEQKTDRTPNIPWDPYVPDRTWPKPWRITYKNQSNSVTTPKLMVNGSRGGFDLGFEYGKKFKRYFKCPKCGSSFVYPLNPEVIVAEAL